MNIAGKRILVTGACGGLGRYFSSGMGREGAKIFVTDIDPAAVDRLVAELNADGVEAHGFAGSVTDKGDRRNIIDAMVTAFGGIDVLLNNAGTSRISPSLEVEEDSWRNIVDVNLTGLFFISQIVGRVMETQGCGSIINLSSIFGVTQAPERAAYCTTKGGVVSLTKTLAIEWAKFGIRVNALAPGYVDVGMLRDEVARGDLDLEPIRKRQPIGRLIRPEEVVDAAIFLASERASAITGQVLAVDGGWTANGYI